MPNVEAYGVDARLENGLEDLQHGVDELCQEAATRARAAVIDRLVADVPVDRICAVERLRDVHGLSEGESVGTELVLHLVTGDRSHRNGRGVPQRATRDGHREARTGYRDRATIVADRLRHRDGLRERRLATQHVDALVNRLA